MTADEPGQLLFPTVQFVEGNVAVMFLVVDDKKPALYNASTHLGG